MEVLNTKIEGIAANASQGDDWRVKVLGDLVSQNFSEYLKLKHAFDDSQYRRFGNSVACPKSS